MLQDLCQAAISIKFNHSEDSDRDELLSPLREKKHSTFDVKCFKCDGKSLNPCRECKGTGRVSSNHPMAALLNQILLKKMGMSSSLEDYENVSPIEEEEEECEDRKLICSECECQFQETIRCSEDLSLSAICPSCLGKFNSNYGGTTKSVELIQQDCTINKKTCFNCSNIIEDCHTICKTCKQQGQDFWICDRCTDTENYKHYKSHVFETVIEYNIFSKDNMEAKSEEFEDDSYQDFFEDIPDELILGDTVLQKKNSSIADNLQSHRQLKEFEDYIEVSPKFPSYKGSMMASQVRVDLDSIVSDYEFVNFESFLFDHIRTTDIQKHHHNVQKKRVSRAKFKTRNSQTLNKDYVFLDYQCDNCQNGPIINVRYHCSMCEDFDLCHKCFEQKGQFHCHEFEKIDGKQLRQKQNERIFMQHDLNLSISKKSYLSAEQHKLRETWLQLQKVISE